LQSERRRRRQHLREIELQIAQYTVLDDFVRPDAFTETFDLVSGEIESADLEGKASIWPAWTV
jgi:hypothetical protein